MHMWHHVTNHLIISNDKDSNSETNENYVFVTVTTKENGMRYIGEARGTPGEAQESSLEACGRV
jgi:hypothetical protein